MTRRSIALAILCGLCFAAIQVVGAQGRYTLQYKFEKGKTYRFADSMIVNANQEMMGQEVKSVTRVISTTRLVPKENTSDGGAVIDVSAEAMRISMKSPQMDTTIVPADMIGMRTRLTVSKRGDVSKREVIDTIKAGGLLRGMGQRDMIRFHIFPDKAVAIGETWKAPRIDTTDAMGGKMVTNANIEYTLVTKEKRSGKDCLKISYKGTMSVSGKGSMNGMEIFVEGTGKMTGTCFVGAADGIPVYEENRSEMESTAAITGQQNMTIPSSQIILTYRTLLGD